MAAWRARRGEHPEGARQLARLLVDKDKADALVVALRLQQQHEQAERAWREEHGTSAAGAGVAAAMGQAEAAAAAAAAAAAEEEEVVLVVEEDGARSTSSSPRRLLVASRRSKLVAAVTATIAYVPAGEPAHVLRSPTTAPRAPERPPAGGSGGGGAGGLFTKERHSSAHGRIPGSRGGGGDRLGKARPARQSLASTWSPEMLDEVSTEAVGTGRRQPRGASQSRHVGSLRSQTTRAMRTIRW